MVDTTYCQPLRVKLPFLKIHFLQDHPWSIGSPEKRSYLFLNFSLKVVSATFLQVCFVCLKENTFEKRKNAFYFTSKALFDLEIYNQILTF